MAQSHPVIKGIEIKMTEKSPLAMKNYHLTLFRYNYTLIGVPFSVQTAGSFNLFK